MIELSGVQLISNPFLVDIIEDWSGVRSPARARRRRHKHPQNIVMRQVPKPEGYFIDAAPGRPAIFTAHPVVIDRIKAQIDRQGSAA